MFKYLALFLILYIISRSVYLDIFVPYSGLSFTLIETLINLEVKVLIFIFENLNMIETVEDNIIFFFNGNSIEVSGGCSGLTQMFIISLVLLFYPGPMKQKLWYIPFSLVLVFISSIIHLLILSYVIIYYPEQYGLAHNYITRIIFYGMYFLIWVYWLEKFVLKKKKKDPVVIK